MKIRLFRIFTELSRHHISVLMAITLFDLILIGMGESLTVCFSLLLPQRIVIRGNDYMQTAASTLTPIPGLKTYVYFMVAICFALFIICLICSYRSPGWLLCAAVMTLLDLGLTVWLIVSSKDPTYFIDLATHIWAVAALVAGYVFERLRRSELSRPPEMTEAAEIDEAVETVENAAAETDEAQSIPTEQ